MARYWLTPTANRHYQRALSETRLNWGQAQAVRYRSVLRAGFQEVADNYPSFNSFHREGLAAGTDFRLHLVGHRYVAFQPYRSDVIIAGVFHESMNIPAHLRELQDMAGQDIEAIRRAIDAKR